MVQVTLKTIAKEAGVSVATVSMALRGTGTISKTREQEIRKIAKKLGYQPNPLLASLASKRFRSPDSIRGTPIAIFSFPSFEGDKSHRSYYHEPLLKQAQQLGYAAEIFKLKGKEDTRHWHRMLYHRMVQGIIISGSLEETEFRDTFKWDSFSVVQCARFHSGQPFHTVRPNIFQAVKLIFSKVREKGYRRIGFALGRHEIPLEDDEARYGAAISMEAAYLPKTDRLPIYEGSFHDADAFVRWVKKYKPEVVIGFHSGQYHALKDAGYSIPEDIGFAVMHRDPASKEDFAGLNQNSRLIAEQSVKLLDQLIRSRETGLPEFPLDLLVPSAWSPGRTLRK